MHRAPFCAHAIVGDIIFLHQKHCEKPRSFPVPGILSFWVLSRTAKIYTHYCPDVAIPVLITFHLEIFPVSLLSLFHILPAHLAQQRNRTKVSFLFVVKVLKFAGPWRVSHSDGRHRSSTYKNVILSQCFVAFKFALYAVVSSQEIFLKTAYAQIRQYLVSSSRITQSCSIFKFQVLRIIIWV